MSSPIRMTGLTSGLDTESIVTALTSGYKTKVDNYKKAQTKVSWKQDAWKDVNKKVYSLYTTLDSMRFSSNWKLQKASSSNAAVASVTSNGKAFTGSQKITVNSVATTANLTGGKLDGASDSTTLAELGYTTGQTATIEVNGKNFTVDSNTTVSSFVSQLQTKANLNANFDSTNKRIYISSKKSGVDGDFDLTGDTNGVDALAALKLIDVDDGKAKSTTASDKYGILLKSIAVSADAGFASADVSISPSLAKVDGEATYTYNKKKGVWADKDGNTVTGITVNGSHSIADGTTITVSGKVSDLEGTDLATAIAGAKTKYTTAADNEKTYSGYQKDIQTGINYANYYKKYHDDLNKYGYTGDVTDLESILKKINVSTSSVFVGDVEYTYDSDNAVYVAKNKAEGGAEPDALRKDGNKYYIMDKKTTTGDDGKETVSYVEHEVDGKTATTEMNGVVTGDKYFETVGGSVLDKVAATIKDKDGKDGRTYDALTDDEKSQAVRAVRGLITEYILTSGYEADVTKDTEAGDLDKGDKKAIIDAVKASYNSTGKIDSVVKSLNEANNSAKSVVSAAQQTQSDLAIVKDLTGDKPSKTADDLKTEVENAFADQAAMNSKINDIAGKSEDKQYQANKVAAVDASITVGGVTYTQASNNFSVNGLSIQAISEGDTSVTVSTDTQGLYDKIKDFFSTYNDVINDLADRYNAESSKGYDPLTEDEKSAMSDTQVEKWEKKGKEGLLRNDNTLNSIMNSITNSMLQSYDVTLSDGSTKKFSLATLGIMTKGILNASTNRQYEYHIDGDEDDTSTASNTDKLKSLLNSDPDSVISFMQQLTNGLYTNLDQKMKRSKLKSAYTIYNDKEMASEYSSYTSLISTWETRLNNLEDSYYEKFAKMESTLSKLQSSTSSLSNSLGR